MFCLIRDAIRATWSAFAKPRHLVAENIALRHQLNVLLRTTPVRPRLKTIDRIFWVWISRA